MERRRACVGPAGAQPRALVQMHRCVAQTAGRSTPSVPPASSPNECAAPRCARCDTKSAKRDEGLAALTGNAFDLLYIERLGDSDVKVVRAAEHCDSG